MPEVQIAKNFRIHYLEDNPTSKQAVLLLHGLGADSTSWQLQIPALTAAGFRVLAPDARGFGKSGYPHERTTIARMARDFAGLIEETGAAPVNVIGISMGGTHAIQLSLDFPQIVRSLILVNTFANLRPKKPSLWIYYLTRLVLVHTLGIPTQARFVTSKIFPHPDQEILRQELFRQILQANPSAYRAAMRALGLFSVVGRLPEIKVPTLVVTGEQDTTVGLENQKVLVDSIPGAQQVFISFAGHAVTVEKPEEFNQYMIKFLRANQDVN